MPNLVVLPRQLAVDEGGGVRSGAQLFVYRAGTTTPMTAYTTAALSATHSSPIESSADGLFPAIYTDPADGNYKLVLQDSDDVTLWTEDNIPNVHVGALPTVIGAASLQCFVLVITNDAGTLKHRFVAESINQAASSFVDKITGATDTLTATPTGTDSSTAFANGGKVGSTNTHEFILNHAHAAADAHGVHIASISVNDTDTDLIVSVVRRSVDVNGTTMARWHLAFRQTSDGGLFALNTSNIAASELIHVQCLLYLY